MHTDHVTIKDNSTSPGKLPDWSNRRADARANHERILAAAVELFAENGVSATIPQIAHRAGVGKATVYRSYATKRDLVAAVASFQLHWLRTHIDNAAKLDADPFETLRTVLHDVVDRLAQDRSLAEGLPRPPYTSDSLHQIIVAAQERGSVRGDVSGRDVQVLLAGVSRVLFDQDEHNPETWHRFAELILHAITEPAGQ